MDSGNIARCVPTLDEWQSLIRFYTKNIENVKRFQICDDKLNEISKFGTEQDRTACEIIKQIMLRKDQEENISDEELKISLTGYDVKKLLDNNKKLGARSAYESFIKYNMLRDYCKKGMDVSRFLDNKDEFTAVTQKKIKEYFESLVREVASGYKHSDYEIIKVGEGVSLEDMLRSRDECTDVGYNQASDLATTALNNGLKTGQLMLLSAPSSCGKSAYMIASASKAGSVEYWDEKKNKWCKNVAGKGQGVIYISTELVEEEFLKQLYCSIAALDRSYFDFPATPEEEDRMKKAVEVAKESNILFVHCTDINQKNIGEILADAKLRGVNYAFIDYIESNATMMEEYITDSKAANAREDNALLEFTKFLKDKVAVGMEMGVMTASQISGGNKYIDVQNRNAQVLANCKSMANKTDISVILSCIPDDEYTAVTDNHRTGVVRKPNRVMTIYKLRAGKYNQTNIYGEFDLGKMRWHDCYAGEVRNGDKKTEKKFSEIFMPKTIIKELNNGYKVPVLTGEEKISMFEATSETGEEGMDMSYERQLFDRNRKQIQEVQSRPQKKEEEVDKGMEVAKEVLDSASAAMASLDSDDFVF